jgi:hypothetical protein
MHSKYPTISRATIARLAVLCFISALLFVTSATAQIAGTGNIQGTVTDSSGAVVPNASVTLTNQATQVKRTTTSNSAGSYIFPGIPIGTYRLEVTAPGFKSYAQNGIVLEVGSNIGVDASLTVGATDEKIEVQAEGLALQTEDPTFKQTIDQNAVTEMPLNGRQMTALITLSGGSNTAPGGDFTGSKYSYQTISVSIAGGGGNTTLWRLDGGDNQDYMANGNLPYPFPDAVSQFSVESTALGAQDGGHVGGMVNVVTRSGTNQYHGTVFEFIRNNYINSTSFYSTCTPVAPATTCSAKDFLHQNEYGATFGGPIKKNKMFAFAGYQRLDYSKKQASSSATVPTAANLAGDFSVTDGVPGQAGSNPCNSSGAPVQLFDPLTGATLTGNKYAAAPTYSPAALALQKYLPKIDPTYDTKNCGFVKYSIPLQQADNQFVTRVDYTVSSKQNIYGRYFLDGYQAPAFYSPTNILITTQSGNSQRVQNFTLGDAYTFSPNLVNAAHISVMRRRNNRGYNTSDINASNLGVTLYQASKAGLQLSEGKFTIGGGTNSLSHFNDNTLAIDDDVTWVKGRHQFNFGGAWIQNQLNIGNMYETNGTFTFNGVNSGSAGGLLGTIGDQTLDFLQGTLSAFEQSKQQQNALRGPIPSLYIQDTFHASKNLTLVGGLRWGPNIMPSDYFNRGLEFSMDNFLGNKVSTVYPNAPAGILYYGDPGVGKEFTQSSKMQFSPNVGASWDPKGDGKTVIRVGGALMFDNPNFFTGQRNQQNPPYATAIANSKTSASGPLRFDAPWSVGAITTSPFPQPQIPTPSQAQYFGQSQYIVLPAHFHAEYTMQWTLSIQQQFAHGWQFQLDYIGNTSRHAPIGLPLNPSVFIPGLWGAGGTGCSPIITTGSAAVKPGAAGTDCSNSGNKLSRYKLGILNPTPGYMFKGESSGSAIASDNGTGNYNGLVATIQHRLSSTFSLLANWTWSKCLNIEDAQGDLAGTTVQDPNNPKGDYGPCGSDYRHIENATLVARSNFHFGNRLTSAVVNNWELAPLFHIASGAALNVTAGQDNSLNGVGNDRPNLVPGVNPYVKTAFRNGAGTANRQYLNTAAFQQVTANCPVDKNNKILPGCQYWGTFGNIRRNSFRTPPFLQFDAQISRVFPIHESLAATLRLEAFNVLNHPDFALGSLGANQSFASSTFGQVGQTASGNAAREFQGSIKISF